MSSFVSRAQRYAVEAHQRIDHRRKYTGQSYEVHLAAVARTVASVTEDERTIAAAWLHDIVEDTPATVHDVEVEFGREVADLVAELTDVSKPSDGNRAARKAIDREHLAAASPLAKTVKLADLIDNCQDITRHDIRFAPTFLDEMKALLEVLEDGDPRLLERARKVHARCAERVAAAHRVDTEALDALEAPGAILDASQSHVARLFLEAFTARDVAGPLLSFDAERDAREVRAAMKERGLQVAGIRVGGSVQGYFRRGDRGAGTCARHTRAFSRGQLVNGEASLSEVIAVLTKREYCFVSLLGEVSGVIVRDDVNRPVVRMWLFGIVTLLEMAITRRVRARYPGDGWRRSLSPARLAKAEALYEERRRREVACDLLDCLQLTDKAQILIEDGSLLDWSGITSKRLAKRAAQELGALRNHLAHSQDIATHDWAQIARMSQRVEEIVHLGYAPPDES